MNVLIHAMDVDSRHHHRAWEWWSASLVGSEYIGLSWSVLAAGGGGDLVPDAHLAALTVENGGTVYSQDADFARFSDVRWINPLAG